jgi:ubiquitin-activating enzyme E1 C
MQAPPVLEEMTRPNLQEPLVRLMGGEKSDVLNINDRRLTGVLRVRVTFRDDAETIDMDTVGTHWLNFWSVLESTEVSVFIITTPLTY